MQNQLLNPHQLWMRVVLWVYTHPVQWGPSSAVGRAQVQLHPSLGWWVFFQIWLPAPRMSWSYYPTRSRDTDTQFWECLEHQYWVAAQSSVTYRSNIVTIPRNNSKIINIWRERLVFLVFYNVATLNAHNHLSYNDKLSFQFIYAHTKAHLAQSAICASRLCVVSGSGQLSKSSIYNHNTKRNIWVCQESNWAQEHNINK